MTAASMHATLCHGLLYAPSSQADIMTSVALAAGSSARAGKRRGHGPRGGGVTATAGKLSRFAPSELQASAVKYFAVPGVLHCLTWLRQTC